MIGLLDVNALVSLAWPNHIHHGAAHRWFASRLDAGYLGWATCPVTESGFVRVSSNPATTPAARAPVEAIELLRRIVTLPGHVFWPDDVSIATAERVSSSQLVGYRQVTDFHLLSLAIRRNGRLVTFDRGILQLVPKNLEAGDVLEVIDSPL